MSAKHLFSTPMFKMTLALLLCGLMQTTYAAGEKSPTVTVRAVDRDYHNALVSVLLPAPVKDAAAKTSGYTLLQPDDGSDSPRCQFTPEGKQTRLTFFLKDLPKGKKRTYRVAQIVFVRAPDNQVVVEKKGADIEISFDKTLFTRYTTQSGPNKPFFYPLLTPSGDPITRRWPVEPDALPGESRDHPHHRGLWFTHSSVNGVDFWAEGAKEKFGRTINTAFEEVYSGWFTGGFRAQTEWRMPDDKLIATDTRDIQVTLLPNGDRVMDFSIVIKPVGGPLVFGDNKDGVFGLRVTDSLAMTADKSSKIPGQGHIETSAGNKDQNAWGKPAEWVDYWGPINGQTYGVAIFDAPTNMRHPQTWHARTYGLFTVNPFGLHDFGRGDKGAGDYTVPADKTFALRYRLLFHKGDTTMAGVAEQSAAFADPPEVKVAW